MFEDASLADEAQRRYLHYALSVIQSRALPDVRDGLKPVQRRILYAMANELHLRPDAKYRKSAAVVGDVMGKFHPHGDTAIYDALARMAQSFSLRAPLVDGRGNFGSADGDAPAAMRYTECKLAPVAMELLSELGKKTVAFRPNFDGTKFEPVVLPARFPNLLVNGAQGIAVGMATSIPPHNLGEVTDACVALIDDPELPLKSILKFIKGPDFPTGGQLVSSRAEIQAVYETGQGSVRLRGEYKTEEPKKGNPLIVITSIPYAIERRAIVEKIAEVIIEKKLPILLDVRDESTDETRIVCEYKREADPALVMAYLYKNTPLAVNVQVNLTCLVPTEHPEIQAPERLDLGAMLRHFLRFRMEVVTKRLGFDLAEIQRRIHLLEGFATIFDALDETIRIIRKSDGKRDAAEKLIKRFSLDEEQVEAILEMRLYKLAQLEIRLIREELDEKRKEAARLNALLKSEAARWKLVRAELLETRTQFGDRRRTRVSSGDQEPQFDAEAFIVDEDQFVLLTQQGWLKRQREVKDVATTRVREGDAVMSVAHGSTKASIAFFSNFGVCFVCRIVDIPATTGYGDPIGKLFKLEDKERIVAMMSFDPRAMQVPPAIEGGEPEPPYAIAVTKDGYTSRFSLRGHREPSTRAGRKYMRVSEGSEILYVGVASPDQIIGCASVASHVLLVNSDEVPVLSGPGKGVMLIKLSEGDALVGARLLFNDRDAFEVENESGKTFSIGPRKYDVSARAGKGHALFKRGSLVRFVMPEPAIPTVLEN